MDSFKLKEFADDNFKFDENGGKFCKGVENTVENRRNRSLRAISPFPTVFSKDLYCRQVEKKGLVWERVNSLPHNPDFNDPKEEGFGKTLGKGENAGNQHFLLFPQCFLFYQRKKSSF